MDKEKPDMNKCKLRGRKLILHWGKLKVEVSKLPYGPHGKDQKDPLFDLNGSDIVLANVYEGSDGKLFDEFLGRPAGPNGNGTCIEGRTLEDYFTQDEFWRTPCETNWYYSMAK